jgi:hypothetical protein
MTLDTTTPTAARTAAFHSDDPPEVSEYRTMSALAIVAFVFGLASPLCFWAPLLMAIPLFGAAFAIVALRRIAASEGALAGRGLALVALALCLVSATASISHDRVTRHLRSNQAEKVARRWIGLLLAGKAQEAFQLTVDGTRPPSPPAPGMPPPTETPLETFTKHPLVKSINAAGAAAEVRFDGMSAYSPLSSSQMVVQQEYSITPAGEAGSQTGSPINIILNVQRSRLAGESGLRWLILSFRDANAAADAGPGV